MSHAISLLCLASTASVRSSAAPQVLLLAEDNDKLTARHVLLRNTGTAAMLITAPSCPSRWTKPFSRADIDHMLLQPGTQAAVEARSVFPTSSRCSRGVRRRLTPLRPQQAHIRHTHCHATSKVCDTCPCSTTHIQLQFLYEEECRTRKAR